MLRPGTSVPSREAIAMKRYVYVLAAAVMLAGCSGATKVERIDPNETVDLSGRWNDTDSRLVSEEMIADCMSRPWKANHVTAKGKNPTIIGDIERAFINSGQAEMVASAEEREQVRGERSDQQQNASEETMKQWGKEHGADYM